MFRSFLKKASVAVMAAAAGLFATASADAGSLVLGNSGWVATWSDPNLGLAVDFQSQDAVWIEKFAVFTEESVNPAGFVNPVNIVFQKISTNAVPYIIINDEMIVNQTGWDWIGFRFMLLPTDGSVQFDAGRTDIAPPGGGFSIEPFTTHQYSQNNTILELGGGVVPSWPIGQNVWFPGATSGELAINTANGVELTAFALKEQPLIIPLPAAAWSGLSGLIGLALLKSRRKVAGIAN
jgi:hypothetical protein